MKSLRVVSLLLLLPALAGQAAPFLLPISPERPVSEAVPHVATGDQHTPVAASNGEISLVAWTDGRDRLTDRVFATRVDAAGNVLDPAGILLSSKGWVAGVVWNGTHFAVALADEGARVLAFVAPDGTVAGKRILDVNGEWADATDGGAGVRILFLKGGERPLASIIDGDGDVIARDLPLVGVDDRGELAVAGSRGSEFLVLLRVQHIPSRVSAMVSVRIDGAQGQIVSRRDSGTSPDLTIYSNRETALEGGPAGWLLVTPDRDRKHLLAQRLDENGVASGAPLSLYEQEPNTYLSTRVRIARESGGFTVIWSTGQGNQPVYTHAAFVTDAGTANASRRLDEWPGHRGDDIVSAGSLRLLVTSGSRTGFDADLFAQTLNDNLTATAPVAVAQSPTAQARVSTAAGANGYLTAWVEQGPDRAVHLLVRRVAPDGTLQGSPLEAGSGPAGTALQNVSAVSNGSHYLVTWRHGTSLLGRRMAATGTWIDAAPFAIGEGWDVAAASNGTDAIAVWSAACDEEACLRSRRIRLAGDPLVEPAVTLLPVLPQEIAVASNGSDYLAVWVDGSECMEWCSDPERLQVLALRLRADATRLDTSPLVLVGEDAQLRPTLPSVAWNGGRYLVAWSVPLEGVKIEGALVTDEGSVVARRVPLLTGSSQFQVAIPHLVAHRDRFVLFAFQAETAPPRYDRIAAWTAVSFDADAPLESVAALPRTVIAHDAAFTLDAASSGSAVLVAYDRLTPAEAGGVARVFTRLFGGVGGRRRAVR
ncbi:MAG TPA: hypothetical protein VGF28_00855 [Thermoanaerobaculia bacterium]|jgi:hypothetical protein